VKAVAVDRVGHSCRPPLVSHAYPAPTVAVTRTLTYERFKRRCRERVGD
jgi:hypothetical protein